VAEYLSPIGSKAGWAIEMAYRPGLHTYTRGLGMAHTDRETARSLHGNYLTRLRKMFLPSDGSGNNDSRCNGSCSWGKWGKAGGKMQVGRWKISGVGGREGRGDNA